jgi:hypothetical protein
MSMPSIDVPLIRPIARMRLLIAIIPCILRRNERDPRIFKRGPAKRVGA